MYIFVCFIRNVSNFQQSPRHSTGYTTPEPRFWVQSSARSEGNWEWIITQPVMIILLKIYKSQYVGTNEKRHVFTFDKYFRSGEDANRHYQNWLEFRLANRLYGHLKSQITIKPHHSGFSQTHKIDNIGININFMLP